MALVKIIRLGLYSDLQSYWSGFLLVLIIYTEQIDYS